MVRLEQNYRSTQVILDAANAVIARNVHRKAKTLRTDLAGGDPVTGVETGSETAEARWIVEEIGRRMLADPGLDHRSFAVLYRTNAQARALEDGFRRRGMPYQIVGGLRFYERREIQDVLAYLRLIANPRDVDAFERVANYPRRGIGAVSLRRLFAFALNERINPLEAAARADEVPGLNRAPRSGLRRLAELARRYSVLAATQTVGQVLEALIGELELIRLLVNEGPEGDDRAENVLELVAAANEFEAESLPDLEDDERDAFTDLGLFLQHVALVADVDRHDSRADAVTLMTLHSSKGLEFPVVFIGGMEEGLFPLGRARDEQHLLEEERRLFYVGLTRARRKVYLTWARSRRRAGDYSVSGPSSFLDALRDRMEFRGSDRTLARPTRGGGRTGGSRTAGRASAARDEPDFNQDRPNYARGERVVHRTFGSGTIVELSGFGPQLKVTVDFDEVGRRKLLVRYADLERDYF